MATTLIINPGSSSKKYALYRDSKPLLTIKFESTGDGYVQCISLNGSQQKCKDIVNSLYETALESVIEVAVDEGLIGGKVDLQIAGIRIVAPGDFFMQHRLIDDEFIANLQEVGAKAPLHVPPILAEIAMVKKNLPTTKLVGVSDSAFHDTVPEHQRRYSLQGATELGIKRFGYHGLSVASVARRLERVFGESGQRTVVLHVGNGVSVVGLKNGQSRYTSMGYTPASGVMMGSRAGDVDPGALIAVLEHKGLSGAEAQKFIQTQGGFVGWLGIRDLRRVFDRKTKKDSDAVDAIKAFTLDLAQAVAGASVTLGGLDNLVYTGTAVERNADLRQLIADHLGWLGVEIDVSANENVYSVTQVISHKDSRVKVAVIPTEEMGEMARVCGEF